MTKNSSTKDLSIKKLFNKRPDKAPILSVSQFKSKQVKNYVPKNVKFFTFNAGFKKKQKDLLFVLFDNPVSVAVAYSKTSTPSAPILWDKKNNKGICKVLIINAGNANAHTGNKGIKVIDKYAKIAAKRFNCSIDQILVSSTGVIGELLDPNKIINKITNIGNNNKDLLSAANSIMTTDTFPKTILKKVRIGSKNISIFGFAKGSGMIAPNMGTMLSYIFIEANISVNHLRNLLLSNLDKSFNSISVDGDTSTSDTAMLFAIGNDKEKEIRKTVDLKKLSLSLKDVMFNLAVQIVSDGEGISKLMKINVSGAKNYIQASNVAFSIANSPLVKTAVAAEDANWGRVIMAIGKSDLSVDQSKLKLKFGKLLTATKGHIYYKIDLKKLDAYMKEKIIEINVDLGLGNHKRTVYASDLTHEYVRINGDYRS